MRPIERRDENMNSSFLFQFARILDRIYVMQRDGNKGRSLQILQKIAYSRYKDLEANGRHRDAYEIIERHAPRDNPLREFLPPKKLD